MEKHEICKIYGRNYREMTRLLLTESKLEEHLAAAGGADPAALSIGIKPNLVSPTPAEYGATTHPEVVAGIIEYLQERGFGNITILEGSWIGDKTSDAYEYCGYRQLCEKYGVRFVDTQKDGSHPADCAGLVLRICDCVDSIDFMINVPVLKGHGQTKITCALKNMKGLIPNSEKRHFHTMGLHRPIAHLSRGIRQDFIVVDHICGDLELEDGGNPVPTDCIMTALDPVLLDAYVCRLLGYDPGEIPYIGLAEELGSGSTDLSRCRISVFREAGGKSAEVPGGRPYGKRERETSGCGALEKFTFGALEEDPFEARRHPDDSLLSVSYAIEDADSCSACYASLAPAILRLEQEGLWDAIRGKLPGKIAIGQGFAGCTGSLGVGQCCRDFDVHVPGCPPSEEDVYRLLRSYQEG